MIRLYEWFYWDDDGHEIHKKDKYKFEILVATYESVLGDVSLLSAIDWRMLVVDEVRSADHVNSSLPSLMSCGRYI